MKEPVHHIKSHAGLRVYSGSKHIGTVAHDLVPYLVVTCAEQLAHRPEQWGEGETAPSSLKRLLQQALLEECAAHSPSRTTAIEAMTQALQALKSEESQ